MRRVIWLWTLTVFWLCRQQAKCGGVCILVQKSCKFTLLDLNKYCSEQDIEVCALRVSYPPISPIVVVIYRSPSGNFNVFLKHTESVLNLISKQSADIIITGDFNINLLADSTTRDQLVSLLETYRLEYI